MTATASPATSSRPARSRRPGDWITLVVPALLAYVPLLLTKPGEVGADTKTYLYLDPAKLLADAPFAWDAQIGMGTVTHQNIGYLFPMGPFYLLFDLVGVPDWVAQRLWLGTLMTLAALGVRYLLRTLDLGGTADRSGGVLVASLAYMLSPYLLDYSARISVILLPWVALPWLIALAANALRRGGWWYPSAFALVVLAVGGINATALIMVGIGPLLWFLHAVLIDKEATPRQALAVVGRIAVLTLVTSVWWIAGLWAEGKYGLPVIRYTETYRAVAQTSSAPEVLRGLGYWFFYGSDKLGPWIEPSVLYTTNPALLALSFALPTAALVTAALVRWRHRVFFIGIIVFGTFVAVAGHPWDGPSPIGGLFKAFTRTNAGLSLRSTPRAVPLVALGTAVFLGVAVAAIGRRLPRLAVPAAVVACGLIALNIPPQWNGTMVAENLKRDEALPDYWEQAAAWLDGRDHTTRVLELPGIDFSSYRWGNTVDPITPGLIDRPYVARELFQWGSPQSAALLNAFDRRLQEGIAEPDQVATIARLLGVGDIVARDDLQFERFRTARPRNVWDLLRRAPGLEAPVGFTEPTANLASPVQPMVDELELGPYGNLPDGPLVSAFPVQDPLPVVRAQRGDNALLVAGDAEGVVDAAAVGLIDPAQPLFLSASFAKDPAALEDVYRRDADLLITDSNRKRAQRWGALRENTGYTERTGEVPPTYDPGDQRLEVFPGATDADATVTEQQGDATITATAYGNPITYTPDDRPTNALDGDPRTAWRVGAIDTPVGERLIIDLDHPVTADHLSLLQPLTNVRNRWITDVRLHFGDPTGADAGDSTVDATLGLESRVEPGQTITFPERTFDHLEIEITGDDVGRRPRYDGLSGVGFAEVRIPGVSTTEVVRPPTTLLDRAGASSADHRLTYLFTRLRSNPAEPVRSDEEPEMTRAVSVPTTRGFGVGGTARLSASSAETTIDALLGLPDATQGGVTATSSARLPSDPAQRASAAFDGDPTTAWTSIYDKQEGHWLKVDLPAPVTFDHLDLQLVADYIHSVPTRLRIEADGQPAAVVDIPPVEAKVERGHTVPVTVPTPPITGRSFRFIIDDVEDFSTKDWYTDRPIVTPVSIAEIGIPGVRTQQADPTAVFDTGCRGDLARTDDQPLWLRITGSVDDALHGRPLTVTPCGPTAAGTSLTAGEHVLRTTPGRVSGIDLDRLVLSSAAGGAPEAEPTSASPVPPGTVVPATSVTASGRVDATVRATGAARPFWLTLGQSWSTGWKATVNGRDLGPPQVINGFANGWYVDPTALGTGPDLDVRLVWGPQRIVWIAVAVSVAGVLAGLALLFFARTARRRPPVTVDIAARPFDPRFERPAWWPGSHRDAPAADHDRDPGDPVRGERAAVAGRPAVVAGLALGAFALVTLPTRWLQLLAAVPYAVAVIAGMRWRRGRGVLGLAGAASLGLAASYYVLQQVRNRYPADFMWPQLFDRVSVLGLLAVLLLLAEAVRELLTEWHEPGTPTADDAPGSRAPTTADPSRVTDPPPPGG
ncbi:MAG: alpha-(1-_3)-arabinofuranosyltransferase family protein [Acidimicrobiales bacterium]